MSVSSFAAREEPAQSRVDSRQQHPTHTTSTRWPHLTSQGLQWHPAGRKMPKRVATLSFAELLRQHRLARGLTQAELAERAGLSERAISDLERGLKQAPRPSTLRLLVRGLALPDANAADLLRAAQSNRVPTTEDGLSSTHHNLPLPTTSFV